MTSREYIFGHPHEHLHFHVVKAESLEEALETFCSTVQEPEKLVGRVERYEPDDCPIGYNIKGHRFEVKPKLPSTASLPDDDVIQVWMYDEQQPHWNTEEPGDHRLLFELPLADIWRYDRWGNVEHPALPAPPSGEMPETGVRSLEVYRGKRLRELTRSDIAKIRRELMFRRRALEQQEEMLNQTVRSLEEELQFRAEQLKWQD